MSFAPIQGEPGALESAPLIVEGRAVDEPYQYLVTIEFGSFQFWYDWGEWDVDKLAYTKDASSKDPAADTVDGGPGWYGFDGVTNRIGVTYQTVEDVKNAPKLKLTLTFQPATVTEDSVVRRVFGDSTMIQVYATNTFAQEDFLTELRSENNWKASLNSIPAVDPTSTEVHEYFLSLTGAPQNADANNSPFRSANAVSLGLFCISIALDPQNTTN